MPKYFMSGTRWAPWERMMMDPSRIAYDDEDREEQEQDKKSVPKRSGMEDSI